jgi:hypothetical protein
MSAELRGTECYVAWDVNLKRRLSRLRSPVDTMGLLFASVGYIGIGMTIPPEVGADVITAFALSFAFFSRAVFVPSTARHTAMLGLLVGRDPTHVGQYEVSRR